jgi:VanZ family protein
VKIEKKLAIAWTLFIIISSLLPSAFVKIQMLDSIVGSDKYLHITVYAIAAVIWLISLGKVKVGERVVLFSGLCLMGLIIEILQITINTGRFFEWYDALANCIGVFAGFVVYNFLFKKHLLLYFH